MKGAIIGDIVGSVFEFSNIDTKEFPLFSGRCDFTDDTVLTCAVAEALLKPERDPAKVLQEIGSRYPYAGYGTRFQRWLFDKDPKPYNSFGNGSAMRVSPAGLLARDIGEAKALSAKVTEVTHNHPEGMKGAECTAVCIVLAKQGKSKEEIRRYVEEHYYVVDKTCDEFRAEIGGHHGAEICQVTMPQALECFYESTGFEDCIRNCMSIGGDSDTIGAIAGAIAEAYYGVPALLWAQAMTYLPADLLDIVDRLYAAAGK